MRRSENTLPTDSVLLACSLQIIPQSREIRVSMREPSSGGVSGL